MVTRKAVEARRRVARPTATASGTAAADLRREGVRDDDRRHRRARCRSSPASTSSSSIRRTPASATAACPTPKASCSSTRAACTGRRSARAASRALEGVRTPSLVAKAVMEQTDHHLLVGQGAQRVRAQDGLHDRGRPEHPRRRDGVAGVEARDRPGCTTSTRASAREPSSRSASRWCARRARSTASTTGARSTATASTRRARSAASRRRAGWRGRSRAASGDSPILGAGLYVDGDVGAAGLDRARRSEPLQPVLVPDRREHAARACTRRTPGMEALAARAGRTRSRSACSTKDGNPNFQLNFYVLNAKGEYAGVVDVPRRATRSAPRTARRRCRCEPLIDKPLTE